MFLGLDLAWNHGFKKLIVKVDSKYMVDALQGSSRLFNHGLNLIRQISRFLPQFEKVQFHHIFRESDQCADYLMRLDFF